MLLVLDQETSGLETSSLNRNQVSFNEQWIVFQSLEVHLCPLQLLNLPVSQPCPNQKWECQAAAIRRVRSLGS